MLKEKVIKSSLKQHPISKDIGKLRSSIDFLTSDTRYQLDCAGMTSLSESCNFAQRLSLPHNERLFKKSSNRSNLANCLVENSSPNILKGAHRQCQNHETKPAQFEVTTEGDAMYYCERCAISLASQGFNVCKIEIGLESSKVGFRSIEFDFLLQHIELIRESINKKTTNARKQQSSKRQFLGKLEEEVNNYFRTIEDTVTNIKKCTLKQFQREKDLSLANQPHNQDVYTDAIKELDSIAKEIRQEKHSAEHLRSLDYKQRLSSYRNRLETYRKIQTNTTTSDVKPQIKLASTNSLTNDLTNLLRVEFNLIPKSHLFSFCKSQNLKINEPSQPVSQFGSDIQ